VQEKLDALLAKTARQKSLLTYRQVAQALEIEPPHVIQQAAELLEALMRMHAKKELPLLASLVVGRAHAGLPAPGYFILLNELGMYQGSVDGEDARGLHAEQVQRCYDAADGQHQG
jgi:hypothetical protein